MCNPLKILLITLSVSALTMAVCPHGDLTGDCSVDFQDVQVLAGQWLAPEGSESEADIDRLNGVEGRDFALLAEMWYQQGIPLLINEFMASNTETRADPQGQYDDWIEIYNAGTSPIDVGGMHLTDNLGNPTKWRIPSGNPSLTTIPDHGYLLIWADQDPEDYPSGLHADFELDADNGEEIGLFDSNGVILIDSIEFPDQTADISYGRYPNAENTWRFLSSPTPGSPNTGAYLGQVADTKFSHNRGFYDAPFSVTLVTDTEDAKIYYTLDGTSPLHIDGQYPTGTLYTTAIPITTTTCLRAVAFRTGFKPTNVDTHTFIFPQDVIDQPANINGYPNPRIWAGSSKSVILDYEMDPVVVDAPAYSSMIADSLKAIPTMSLVTGRALMGSCYCSSSSCSCVEAGAYYWCGKNCPGESPASIELMYPDDPDGSAQADCGVQAHSHPRLKRSMRLSFRAVYGDSKFRSDIFERAPLSGDSAGNSINKIVLRGGNNRSWARVWNPAETTYTMDQWFRDSQIAMSGVGSHGTFVHLYINGIYWGIYNPVERPDAAFAAMYLGGEDEDWYSVSHGGSHGGSATRFNYLKNTLVNKNMSDPANYAEMQEYLNLDSYIDYIMLSWFGGVGDWPQNNWWGGNRNYPPEPFEYFLWDAEWSWETTRGHNNGWVAPDFRSNDSGGPTIAALWHSLRVNDDFMMLFADRVYKHLFNDGVLTDDNCIERYLILNDFIRDAIVAESARWGDSLISAGKPRRTRNVDWIAAETETIGPGFMADNVAKFINSLRNEGYYPDLEPPQFNLRGGHVDLGFAVTLANPNSGGTIYYTVDGSDPRVPGVTTTTSSTKLVKESDSKRVLVPTGPGTSINWRGGGAFDDSAWYLVSGSPGGVGYDDNHDYDPYISYDVDSLMNADYNPSANTTAYVRIPFTVEPDADFDFMTLGIRFDDGFVAFINGSEVWQERFSGDPVWNSHASNGHEARSLDSFDISHHLNKLRSGGNILAVHALNDENTSSDFLCSVELVAGNSGTGSAGGDIAPTAIEYAGQHILSKSTHLKTRTKSGSTWSPLNEAVFSVGSAADCLRITEIMYHPLQTGDPNDPNEEYIELTNKGGRPINLNLVSFTNGVDFTFGDWVLQPGGYVLVVKNQDVFAAEYGDLSHLVAGQYAGSLNNGGERIELRDARGRSILNFRFRDGWRSITDGMGHSLTIIDPTNPDPNSWGRENSWRPSVYAGGSPGYDDSGILPNPGDIVINEILAHSHGAEPDWIELYNTTDSQIDIGGWYLSDSQFTLKKYRFADGTRIDAHDYLLLYQDVNFGDFSTDPGKITGFAFSENGDQAYLSSAEGDVLTGYRAVEDFGASYTGISFGRYYKTSTQSYNFVPMDHSTPGYANAYPAVGPIVISEIMYNPDWPAGGMYANDRYEYIELHNITDAPVKLYRDDKALPWKFSEGIEYIFPDYPDEVTIGANDYIVVVRDVNAFTWRYPSVPTYKIYGPYDGQLDNGGERIELSQPGDIDKFGRQHYIRIDRVTYSDGSHPGNEPGDVDLWPIEADGGGKSLTRVTPRLYGNDPNNWVADTPTPGDSSP